MKSLHSFLLIAGVVITLVGMTSKPVFALQLVEASGVAVFCAGLLLTARRQRKAHPCRPPVKDAAECRPEEGSKPLHADGDTHTPAAVDATDAPRGVT